MDKPLHLQIEDKARELRNLKIKFFEINYDRLKNVINAMFEIDSLRNEELGENNTIVSFVNLRWGGDGVSGYTFNINNYDSGYSDIVFRLEMGGKKVEKYIPWEFMDDNYFNNWVETQLRVIDKEKAINYNKRRQILVGV